MEVEFKRRAFANIPASLAPQVKRKLEKQLAYVDKRARKKWLEPVEAGGHRVQVSCHKLNGLVRVSKITILKGKKGKKGPRPRKPGHATGYQPKEK